MIFIPFGSNCSPTIMLNHMKLRNQSLPFDWIYGHPKNIRQALDSQFEDWFDLGSLEVVNVDDKIMTKHKNYPSYEDGERNQAFFAHHNLTDLSVQDKFRNRVARFYDLINSDQDLVFLTIAPYEQLHEYGLLDYFKRKGKTLFVSMRYVHSEERKLIVNEYIDCIEIIYLSPSPFDPKISVKIYDYLKSLKYKRKISYKYKAL